MKTLRVGTRASRLALRQTQLVIDRLRVLHPRHDFVIERIATQGDMLADVPLAKIAGRGVFVGAIEEALRRQRIDIAVHSAKDLPAMLDDAFQLAALMERADPRDVCVSRAGDLDAMPAGARVGTSSQRRACQIRARRPDLEIVELRGNVDTRLRKLDSGACDAIVLAAAGLTRLGLESRITEYLDPRAMLPCPGQGALAVEVRAGGPEAELVVPLSHSATVAAVAAERAFLARLGTGCTAAVGAWARPAGSGTLALDAFVGTEQGQMIRGARTGPAGEAAAIGMTLAEDLLARGAAEMLDARTSATQVPDA